jgi:hypothetical protein
MFTSIDKALVAAIMAFLYLMNNVVGINIGLSEATVTSIVAVLTPILVWLIPNKSDA